jgi:hypothetical protein
MKQWFIVGILLTRLVRAELSDGLALAVSFDDAAPRDGSPTAARLETVGSPARAPGPDGFDTALDFRVDPAAGILVGHDFGEPKELSLSVHLNVSDPDPARWNYALDTRSEDFDVPEGAFYVGRNRDNTLRMADSVLPSDAYPRHVWFHLAILADGKGVSFYVDGSRVGTEPAVGLNIGDRLVLGNRFTLREGLYGLMDDFAMWNRLLNPTEIAQLRVRPVPVSLAVSARERAATVWARLKTERNRR